MTTLFEQVFYIGAQVRGKWNNNRYTIKRILGEGANGKVFLVSGRSGLFAMKVGYNSLDLQSEVNALKALSEKSRSFQRYLLDVDDIEHDSNDYPYYVMPYMRGNHVLEYLKHNGSDWMHLIGQNVLKKLTELHAYGWVFGDLKLENMIVAQYGRVDLVDYGGVTKIGRSVKQFTEINDRGYWNAGSRSADESYDVFAFAMIIIQMIDPFKESMLNDSLLPQNRDVQLLLESLKRNPLFKPIAPFLRKALLGRFSSSQEALKDWKRIHSRKLDGEYTKTPWLKFMFVLSLLLFFSTLYFVWR